ncbi:MAG: hypothetical protein KIT18_15765 [Burkholderiales bacterium]|nr:hypothetical protein [Burkholderiales bacterium]
MPYPDDFRAALCEPAPRPLTLAEREDAAIIERLHAACFALHQEARAAQRRANAAGLANSIDDLCDRLDDSMADLRFWEV